METIDTTRKPVPLTELMAGERGELQTAELERDDRELLYALGLTEASPFRLCKTGNPWIVQVRSTRIGLSDSVARSLMVLREQGPNGERRNGGGS